MKPTEPIGLANPPVIVLAEGDTPGGIANAKGQLFEQFFARLLSSFGYVDPTTEDLNVTDDGIEVDVSVRHKLTGHPADAECKAYTKSVPAHELSAFTESWQSAE